VLRWLRVSPGLSLVTSEDLKVSDVAKQGDMWSPEGDDIIIKWVSDKGRKWQGIAQQLPDRSCNAVRNRYLRRLPQAAPHLLLYQWTEG